MNSTELDSLVQCIRSSNNIMAIIGAGLSRPSGLPTFRQEGASWRGRPTEEMARKSTFEQEPISIWTFYENRRQMARVAQPNAGHIALATLAKAKPNFLAITQNIDGHDTRNLVPIHGSLFAFRCSDDNCAFTAENFSEQPTVPGLNLPPWDISDPTIPLPHMDRQSVPSCPHCGSGILRPGVIWFGEKLPPEPLTHIDEWLCAAPQVDLVLVIGTTRTPFAFDALARGARMAYFNVELDIEVFEDDDWLVEGDASWTLPHIIGKALEIPL